jgi:hypothetical protein
MTKPPTMQQGHSNDFQTPTWALDPLYPFIDKERVIWECACGRGNLSNALHSNGFRVWDTDILTGTDFLTCEHNSKIELHSVSYIITNPPYTLKDEFLQHCYYFGLPFALLMPLTALEGIKRQNLYREYGLELILLPRRVNFETPSGEGAGAWFASAWFTNGFNIGKAMTFWKDEE